MKCSQCGSALKQSMIDCPQCGHSKVAGQALAQQPQQPNFELELCKKLISTLQLLRGTSGAQTYFLTHPSRSTVVFEAKSDLKAQQIEVKIPAQFLSDYSDDIPEYQSAMKRLGWALNASSSHWSLRQDATSLSDLRPLAEAIVRALCTATNLAAKELLDSLQHTKLDQDVKPLKVIEPEKEAPSTWKVGLFLAGLAFSVLYWISKLFGG